MTEAASASSLFSHVNKEKKNWKYTRSSFVFKGQGEFERNKSKLVLRLINSKGSKRSPPAGQEPGVTSSSFCS